MRTIRNDSYLIDALKILVRPWPDWPDRLRRPCNEKSSSNDDILDEENMKLSSFQRNESARIAFRTRSQSREFSPESAPEVSSSDLTSENVSRSPTTGALISSREADLFMDEEIPEYNEMALMAHTLDLDDKRLSQNTGSQSSQDSMKNTKLTVRERTQRWEARGGGLPSYFSTLPKSFRHKATDRRKDPAYAQYMAEHEEELRLAEMMGYEHSGNPGSSRASRTPRASTGSHGPHQSGIPLPVSKMRAANARQGGRHEAHHSSASPESQNYHMRMHSADDGARSLNSSGQSHSSNDNSLERRLGEGQEGVHSGRGSNNLMSGRHTGSEVRETDEKYYSCALIFEYIINPLFTWMTMFSLLGIFPANRSTSYVSFSRRPPGSLLRQKQRKVFQLSFASSRILHPCLMLCYRPKNNTQKLSGQFVRTNQSLPGH